MVKNNYHERCRLICEYIAEIISDPDQVIGIIKINKELFGREELLVTDIYVPIKGFERHYNLEINISDTNIFSELLLTDLIDTFNNSKKVSLSKYADHEMKDHSYIKGIEIKSNLDSKVILEFVYQGDKFNEQILKYNAKTNSNS